jgi:Spx/MgsR family transcriptional regulator
MNKIQVFGIPNCSSVKKARVWLDEHGVPYDFHDFKKQGLPESALDSWLQAVGHEVLLNRKGTTWRGLSATEQASVVDQASARAVLLKYPSLVKRPVLVAAKKVIVGVNPDAWSSVV